MVKRPEDYETSTARFLVAPKCLGDKTRDGEKIADRLSTALIQMRDWCASVGRDTNSERNHGRQSGGETCSLSEELQRTRLSHRRRDAVDDIDRLADESRNPRALDNPEVQGKTRAHQERCCLSIMRAALLIMMGT